MQIIYRIYYQWRIKDFKKGGGGKFSLVTRPNGAKPCLPIFSLWWKNIFWPKGAWPNALPPKYATVYYHNSCIKLFVKLFEYNYSRKVGIGRTIDYLASTCYLTLIGDMISFQNYIRKFKLSNAEMSQLWQTFEESSNYSFSIGDIMDTWTRQMGFPVVTIRHLSGDKYQINQKRFLVNANDNFDPRTSPYG